MIRNGLLLGILALVLSCATDLDRCADETPPFVALVVTPDLYDGCSVIAAAWGVVEFEMAGLFLSPLDWPYLISENGIAIEGSDELFSELAFPYSGMLQVQGVFRAGDPVRGFQGRIEAVRIYPMQRWHNPDSPPHATPQRD